MSSQIAKMHVVIHRFLLFNFFINYCRLQNDRELFYLTRITCITSVATIIVTMYIIRHSVYIKYFLMIDFHWELELLSASFSFSLYHSPNSFAFLCFILRVCVCACACLCVYIECHNLRIIFCEQVEQTKLNRKICTILWFSQ